MGEVAAETEAGRPGPASVDMVVNEVVLYDSLSVIAAIGRDKRLVDGDVDGDTAGKYDNVHISLVNGDSSEVLTLIFHEGGMRHEVAQMRVRAFSRRRESGLVGYDTCARFVSGKGIALGTRPAQVIERLGTPTRTEERAGETWLVYELWDETLSYEVLRKVKMPGWEGVYVFVDDVLVDFGFGYPYP